MDAGAIPGAIPDKAEGTAEMGSATASSCRALARIGGCVHAAEVKRQMAWQMFSMQPENIVHHDASRCPLLAAAAPEQLSFSHPNSCHPSIGHDDRTGNAIFVQTNNCLDGPRLLL